MSKDKPYSKLVPELRFPEFDGNLEWKDGILGNKNISTFVNDKTPKENLNIETYVSTENLLPEYGGVKKANKLPNSGSFTHYKVGDILIANIRPYLKKVWFAEKDGAASNDVIVIRAGAEIEKLFLLHILKNDSFINYVMKGAKGVKMPRGDKSLMKKYFVPIPEKNEQQKIANTLTSLDHWIGAENEKLEALKAHKKGLLQQLFPAKGERVPRVRFGEFEGDWEEKILIQIADYENGKAHEKEISDLGKYKVVNSKFISTNGEVVKFSNSVNCETNIGDILMVLSDVPNGKAIAKCFYVDKENTYTVNQRICRITPTDVENRFLFYLLNRNPYFLSFDDGVKQTNLRKDTVLNCPLLIPENPKEQEKIANCLFSLNDSIAAQSEKIKALKAHKKGLMQQLFPNANK